MSTQATPELDGHEDFVNFMLDWLTPEERLAGHEPEQVASAQHHDTASA